MPSPTIAVIVVAAGSGSRLGTGVPKAFTCVAGRTILERCLDEVFAVIPIPQVIVVVPDDRIDETRTLLSGTNATTVGGGATRQCSVAKGLVEIGAEVKTVLVHDAARPFTPASLFRIISDDVERTGQGVVPGLPVMGTVKRVRGGDQVVSEFDRGSLREVQTPQGFPRLAFEDAHRLSSEDHTDDAALFANAGHPVLVVQGDARAFKITTSWDLRRAEHLIAAEASTVETDGTRTGIGVDIHAFDAARPLWLGCLFWPGEPGLAGHSDGDALCHALCDALLSAAGLGDVGSRFGTDDERFTDVAGSVFVTETVALVAGAGLHILNVAVQVIANRPKIGMRRAELEALLSSMVGAPVSIGATTSDGLGFTGDGSGLAVIATCLLARS